MSVNGIPLIEMPESADGNGNDEEAIAIRCTDCTADGNSACLYRLRQLGGGDLQDRLRVIGVPKCRRFSRGDSLGADGSTTHGKDVPLDGTTTRAGNFSIPGHSTRWLIDDSNARSGTQSVRLSESAPDC